MQNFETSGLNKGILKAISELGFETPTPIQEKTIPHLLNENSDLIGMAQTGTGKTAAFGLPIVQLADSSSLNTQALILCPTRELCIQITRDFENFLKYQDKLKIVAVYGGAAIDGQIKDLKKGAQIVAGTPGRVQDLIRRKVLNIRNIRWLVLDEADEMLNMGFRDELDAILENTPKERQTLLFSATMPPEINHIARRYMNDPVELTVGKKNVATENVEHFYYMVQARDRYIALKRILDINPDIYAIVFCRTRQETKDIADKLMQDNYNADALHGDLSQSQRDYVMNRFRNRSLQVLVATDVAARGLDVNDLSHVINYNLPDESEVYVHRTGRTGRAGKKGISVSLIHSRESSRIRNIERILGRKLVRKMVPGGREICEKQLFSLIDKMEKVEVNESQISPFLPVVYKKLEWLSKEEIIKHFVSLEFNRFLEYYKNAPDINLPEKVRPDRKSSERQPSERQPWEEQGRSRIEAADFARFYINLGSKHKLNPAKLIALINENTRGSRIDLGKIEILRNFSFFDADSGQATLILKSFRRAKYEGIPVVVDIKTSVERPADDDFEFRKKKEKEKIISLTRICYSQNIWSEGLFSIVKF